MLMTTRFPSFHGNNPFQMSSYSNNHYGNQSYYPQTSYGGYDSGYGPNNGSIQMGDYTYSHHSHNSLTQEGGFTHWRPHHERIHHLKTQKRLMKERIKREEDHAKKYDEHIEETHKQWRKHERSRRESIDKERRQYENDLKNGITPRGRRNSLGNSSYNPQSMLAYRPDYQSNNSAGLLMSSHRLNGSSFALIPYGEGGSRRSSSASSSRRLSSSSLASVPYADGGNRRSSSASRGSTMSRRSSASGDYPRKSSVGLGPNLQMSSKMEAPNGTTVSGRLGTVSAVTRGSRSGFETSEEQRKRLLEKLGDQAQMRGANGVLGVRLGRSADNGLWVEGEAVLLRRW